MENKKVFLIVIFVVAVLILGGFFVWQNFYYLREVFWPSKTESPAQDAQQVIFTKGIDPAFKDLPLYGDVKENSVWTMGGPYSALFYVVSGVSIKEVETYYKQKLQAGDWALMSETEDSARVEKLDKEEWKQLGSEELETKPQKTLRFLNKKSGQILEISIGGLFPIVLDDGSRPEGISVSLYLAH